MIGLALAFMIQSGPPPFLQYAEEAEALGRAAYLGGVCAGMGVVEGDQEAVVELFDDFQRRATLARTDGPVVEAALTQGLEREKAAITLMMEWGADDGSEHRQRRENQAAEYFGNNCAALVRNYPTAFKLPAKD